ncbi:hypothetical protein K435DRAFT_405080 [Dendrothele bispora CBS 962.96]|uniref:Uncharacterized protein n=1 Tax=Dendrothele bispora (strain CBS 962.96) TaxID=1314807 RepID=A0A4S8L793_DENBC|nr:hypothetical protein K435DRAFT_405080 [Dendrothele bispora CBS 962.96]
MVIQRRINIPACVYILSRLASASYVWMLLLYYTRNYSHSGLSCRMTLLAQSCFSSLPTLILFFSSCVSVRYSMISQESRESLQPFGVPLFCPQEPILFLLSLRNPQIH